MAENRVGDVAVVQATMILAVPGSILFNILISVLNTACSILFSIYFFLFRDSSKM